MGILTTEEIDYCVPVLQRVIGTDPVGEHMDSIILKLVRHIEKIEAREKKIVEAGELLAAYIDNWFKSHDDNEVIARTATAALDRWDNFLKTIEEGK